MYSERSPQNPEEARQANERHFLTLQTEPESLIFEIINKYGNRQLSEEDKVFLMLPLSSPSINTNSTEVTTLIVLVTESLKAYYYENTHWACGTPHNYFTTICLFLCRNLPEVSRALKGAVYFDSSIKMTTITDAACRFRDRELLKCNFQSAPLLACCMGIFLGRIQSTPGARREPFNGCLVLLCTFGICACSLIPAVGFVTGYFK